MLKAGHLRPLISRVYTSNMDDPIDRIVRRNIWLLISHVFPEAIISHRTAIEYLISPQGNLYLTSGSRRVYRRPGVKIRIAERPGPLPDDAIYMHDLRGIFPGASMPRKFIIEQRSNKLRAELQFIVDYFK